MKCYVPIAYCVQPSPLGLRWPEFVGCAVRTGDSPRELVRTAHPTRCRLYKTDSGLSCHATHHWYRAL